MKAFSLVLCVGAQSSSSRAGGSGGEKWDLAQNPGTRAPDPSLSPSSMGEAARALLSAFPPLGDGLTSGLNAPDRAIPAQTWKHHQGQVLCAQEGRRGALGDGGTLIHLCSSAPVPTPGEAKGKAHPGHSTSNILASPWWASGLWLWFQLSQPARAPLFWPSAPPGLVQALLLIYIFIVCLPGFSPERFIFHSCFDMTAQASFSRKDKTAPLEICHIAKDIYFS